MPAPKNQETRIYCAKCGAFRRYVSDHTTTTVSAGQFGRITRHLCVVCRHDCRGFTPVVWQSPRFRIQEGQA